jgi:hypothetical protein
MKDIYNHFTGSWVSAEDLHSNSLRSRLLNILYGIIAGVFVFAVSLTILCGLIGG